MQIIIPAAGIGSRFRDSRFKEPKPLIKWNHLPMLHHVLDNFIGDYTKLILIKQKQYTFYYPGISIIDIDYITDGPATTANIAKDLIDQEQPLLITNCDQIIKDWNKKTFLNFANHYDAVLGGFISHHPGNSYVKLDNNNNVIEVKEKIVISNLATTGLHFWQKAKYFFDSYKQMISDNNKTNNEYYIAPSFQYLINTNYKVGLYMFNQHYPVGTPEQLERFLQYENRQN